MSPVTFRLPSVLAKAAATVDEISGGRVEIGMGAGWWTEEHTQFGFPFPPTRERFEMLEEQLEIVHGLLTEERFTFDGRHYTLKDAEFLPAPVQRPRPPIVLGGQDGRSVDAAPDRRGGPMSSTPSAATRRRCANASDARGTASPPRDARRTRW